MTARIVCAVDQSAGARHALGHAVELADDLGFDLDLVHVAADGPYAHGSRAAVERGRHAAWAAAQELFRELRVATGLGGDAPGEVVFGSAAQVLTDISRDRGTALVVVGSRGRGPFRSAVLGSTSSRLATRAECPVLIVPPPANCVATARTRGVVCGVADGALDGAEVVFAGYLADRLGDELRVVQVDTSLSLLPPARAIEEVARNEGARLIVVGSESRGRFGALLLGSLSAQLTSTGGRPVIVVPPDYEPPGRDPRLAAAGTAA